jgi:hypothetical protein
MTQGILNCTVTLKHPLPGLDMYHGFDVRGVFMHNGSLSLDYASLTYGDPDSDTDAVLLNADGYTRWFNFPEFDGNGAPILEYFPGKLSDLQNPSAMLNGFKIFADNLDAEDSYYEWITTPGNADDRGLFGAGQVNSRRYEMKFPMPGGSPLLHFQYAVVATWEPGDPTLTGSPVYYDPFDFPTSANCEEAFFVNSNTDNSSMFYVDPGNLGGSFIADVEVFDWQGGSVGNTGVINEIERMIIEADFLPSGPVEYSPVELASMAMPATDNSSTFMVDISQCTPQSSGENEFWVIVESAGLNGESYGQGFPTEYPDDARRGAFYRGSVTVGNQAMGLTVTSIDPDTVPFWSQVDGAVITGADFMDGATVELRKDPEPPVSGLNVVWNSSSEITCDFDLTNVDSGAWDVVVINPGGAEGVLEDGFVIDPWSEEILLEQSGNRNPQMAETSGGNIVLGVACNDSTLKYHTWESAWDGPFQVDTLPGHWMMYMTSDPVNDYVYFACAEDPQFWKLYRYTGGTGTWERRDANFVNQYMAICFADPLGGIHTVSSTTSSYGHVVQCRADSWANPWILPPHWFYDDWNDKELSMGSIWCQDSTGQSYVVYEKDRWKDPYNPGTGRYIKMGIMPQGDWVLPVVTIDAMPLDYALDSPAVTVDSNDKLHAAYRRYNYTNSQWEIHYKSSSNSGQSWDSDSVIWSGADEPVEDYTFIYADGENVLHAAFEVDGYLIYRNSTDGVTWSDSEVANESIDDEPPGTGDFMPRMIATSENIAHFAWIRGLPASGYGDIHVRMRDLE